MEKIIPFNKGIRRSPSIGEAGELSELVNLVPKGGELVNAKGVKAKLTLTSGYSLACVHHVDNKKHYILTNGSNIAYRDDSTSQTEITINQSIGKIANIVAIGTMLVVSTDVGNAYLRWTNGSYVFLGTKIPHLNVAAWTDYNLATHTGAVVTPSNGVDKEYCKSFEGSYQSTLNNERRTKFLEPFMLRYAYRMYDGRLFDCSPPILIPCASDYPALVYHIKNIVIGDVPTNQYQITDYSYRHILKVKYNGTDLEEETLKKMTDLIQAVEFYISPISLLGDTYMYKAAYEGLETNIITGKNTGTNSWDGIEMKLDSNIPADGHRVWWQCSQEELNKRVLGATDFYLLKSVPLVEFIKGSEVACNGALENNGVPTGFVDLTQIATQKKLIDPGVNDELVGGSAYHYNGRLIKGNLKRYLYQDVKSFNFFPYSNGGDAYFLEIYVKIQHGAEESVIKIEAPKVQRVGRHNNEWARSIFRYFFYPHDGAKEVTFVLKDYLGNAKVQCNKNLSLHPTMVGAYLYNDLDDFIGSTSDFEKALTKSGNEVDLKYNEIAFSEVNNPFAFSSTSRIAVGDGNILGLASAAKAISTGQFGQFPLYAFCTDGIWALEVASDGTFSSCSPVSRDVCNNADSITQIDGAVVFTTDQGLKLIQGGEVMLLSAHMGGRNVDESSFFTEGFFKDHYSVYNRFTAQDTALFVDMLRHCKIAYDYANNRLCIFPQADYVGKYYTYDLGTQEYGCSYALKQITHVVHDYPSSYVQYETSLCEFATKNDPPIANGLLLTRTITLDDPTAYKKLRGLKLQQTLRETPMNENIYQASYGKVIVWVSNDRKTWRQLTSLRGGSYKYFRFGVITQMKDDEALTGLIVRYDVERTNKLR